MVISTASGKGGTGKTTVSTSLAWTASLHKRVAMIDCDVEEPDAHFYVRPEWTGEKEVAVQVPSVDADCCDGCGRCAEVCRFNALAALQNDVLVFPELCHSCGACRIACPLDCISMVPRRVGVIRSGEAGRISFQQGLLDIGEPMPMQIIRELKDGIDPGGLTIIDCPPGAGCPMIGSVQDSDYCVLVTEPSPFGLHDLRIACEVTSQLGIPHGVVINRSTGEDGIIEEFCSEEGLDVIGKIPYSREIAVMCSSGELIAQRDPGLKEEFEKMLEEVERCRSSLPS